jgi:hypothetical protein
MISDEDFAGSNVIPSAIDEIQPATPPTPRSLRIHAGCTVDSEGFYRACLLPDGGKHLEIVGPKFRMPRDAIKYAEKLKLGEVSA